MSGVGRLFGFVGGAGAFAVLIVYLGVIAGQGDGFSSRVVFIAAWLLVAGALALVAGFGPSGSPVTWLQVASAAMLAVLTVVSALSIGILILPLVVVVAVGAIWSARAAGPGAARLAGGSLLALSGAVAAMWIGLAVTNA